MVWQVSLDRSLPIPIRSQIRGQIEYGIASGALRSGERLPSVREFAAAQGVAQVTVSAAYSALKQAGLIAMRPGVGAYVVETRSEPIASEVWPDLFTLVDSMVDRALERGYTSSQIYHMVTARLSLSQSQRPLIAIVGLFAHATDLYARDVAALLADLAPEVRSITLDVLSAGDGRAREAIASVDMILTPANRVNDLLRVLAPTHPPVHGLTFVAHPRTIAQLRALPPEATLGVISTFAEFLPTMLQGISECVAPLRAPLSAVLSHEQRVRAVVSTSDAIIFASGSEAVLDLVTPGKPVIEYLHSPEPSSVAALRPLLERLSRQRSYSAFEGR